MTTTKTLFVGLLGLLLLGIINEASANLIINVSDAGAGQTRWQYSGSTTVVQGGNTYRRGIMGLGWNESPVSEGTDFFYPITSGFGSMTTTTGGTYVMAGAVAKWGGSGVGAYTDTPVIFHEGHTLSWTGDLIVDLPFYLLNAGVFTTNTIDSQRQDPSIAWLSDTMVLTIVPEPSSLGLVGIGACAGAARRRRLKGRPL